MKKREISLICICVFSFLFGFCLGRMPCWTGTVLGRQMHELVAGADGNYFIHTLELLREGDIEKAIERLEYSLDLEITSTYDSFVASESTDKQYRSFVEAFLVRAKVYRDKYPRIISNQVIEKSVAEALFMREFEGNH